MSAWILMGAILLYTANLLVALWRPDHRTTPSVQIQQEADQVILTREDLHNQITANRRDSWNAALVEVRQRYMFSGDDTLKIVHLLRRSNDDARKP